MTEYYLSSLAQILINDLHQPEIELFLRAESDYDWAE